MRLGICLPIQMGRSRGVRNRKKTFYACVPKMRSKKPMGFFVNGSRVQRAKSNIAFSVRPVTNSLKSTPAGSRDDFIRQ